MGDHQARLHLSPRRELAPISLDHSLPIGARVPAALAFGRPALPRPGHRPAIVPRRALKPAWQTARQFASRAWKKSDVPRPGPSRSLRDDRQKPLHLARILPGCWLVQQQEPRPQRERGCQSHAQALPLAEGQGGLIQQRLQSKACRRVARSRLHFGGRGAQLYRAITEF